MKKGRPSNYQEVGQSLFFIAIELFFGATTIEEVMATWLLSEEVFENLVRELILACMHHRHFDDRQS